MLMRVNKNTWIYPPATRIALITDAQCEESRRIWIVCPGTIDEPMEVERQYHAKLLAVLDVSLGVLEH